MWTVQKNAHNHKDEFPEAAECVLKSTIVDDHLDSCPTAAKAIKIVSDLVVLYKKIGLNLRKVTRNNAEVLENLPEAVETSENMKDFSQWGPQEREMSVDTMSKMPHMRALGQRWNMLLDEFLYNSYTPDTQIFWTKLYCLCQSARLFDPLGFIAPILLLAKLFIQALWKRSAKWLDALTEEETEEWLELITNLPILHLMRFPRVLKKGLPSTYKSVQMHVFADASKVCFAVVAHIRIEYHDGTIHTNFVMAKSSINPASPARTIPKLELMAVDKAVKLAHHVNKPLGIEMTETFSWTESKTALQWLAMPEGNLQVLPHNYCKKIKAEIHDLRQV
jgi:hypothetical protein